MKTIDEVLQAYPFRAIGEQNPKIKQIKGIISNSKPNPHKLFAAEGIWMLSLCESHGHKNGISTQIFAKRNISQLKLALDLNMNQNSISRYENREREADYDTLIRFADYFDVSLDYLLGRTDEKKRNRFKSA